MTEAIRTLTLCLAVIAVGLFSAGPADAITPKRLSKHKDWEVFSYVENDSNVCFIASSPKKSAGDYTKRGKVFMLVAHMPARSATGEVSFVAGYRLKQNSKVTASIDRGRKISLFTRDERAWTENPKADKDLVRQMRRGLKMKVRGVSWRGTKTTDDFSLRGFTAAYRAMNRACGVR